MLLALLDAADRGVRVRLLLDDFNLYGRAPALAAVRAHPNIEVRLFNPASNFVAATRSNYSSTSAASIIACMIRPSSSTTPSR
jgi:phosphatidylserine/phosphatidylglycerophosphate/cardiolipin synthase-like enzyme